MPFTASPEVTAKGRRWVRLLSELLVKTNLRPNPILILPRGLAGVAQGFQYMSEGKVRIQACILTSTFYSMCCQVSAEKITYRIADTVKE